MVKGELTLARPLPVCARTGQEPQRAGTPGGGQGPPGAGMVPGTEECSLNMCEQIRDGQGEKLERHWKEGGTEHESTEACVIREESILPAAGPQVESAPGAGGAPLTSVLSASLALVQPRACSSLRTSHTHLLQDKGS